MSKPGAVISYLLNHKNVDLYVGSASRFIIRIDEIFQSISLLKAKRKRVSGNKIARYAADPHYLTKPNNTARVPIFRRKYIPDLQVAVEKSLHVYCLISAVQKKMPSDIVSSCERQRNVSPSLGCH